MNIYTACILSGILLCLIGCDTRLVRERKITIEIDADLCFIAIRDKMEYRTEIDGYNQLNFFQKIFSRKPLHPKPVTCGDDLKLSSNNQFVPLVCGENEVRLMCADGDELFIKNSSNSAYLCTMSENNCIAIHISGNDYISY